MEEGIKLTAMEKDALKEISNLGSAKATNTLSAITGKPIKLTVPYLKLVPIEKITALLGGPHEILACTPVKMFEGRKAVLITIFERKTAMTLVDLMKKTSETPTRKIEEMDVSTFIEFSHILNNAYLNPLANFFDEKFVPENTQIVLDSAAITAELTGTLESSIRYSLVIGTDFQLPGEKEAEGKFLILLDELLLRTLLDALDRKLVAKKGKIF